MSITRKPDESFEDFKKRREQDNRETKYKRTHGRLVYAASKIPAKQHVGGRLVKAPQI